MKLHLIFFCVLLLATVESNSQEQRPKKRPPANPVVHVLKVDSPLQVDVNSIPSKIDTVFIDGRSTINIKQEENPYKPWIAPIAGIVGVLIGFVLNWIKDSFSRKDQQKQKLIDDLTFHKIKIDNLIFDLINHVTDAAEVSVRISRLRTGNHMKGFQGIYDKEIEKADASLDYNSKRINEILSEFRAEVVYFHRYFRGNLMFESMMRRLIEFDPDLKKLKRTTLVHEAEKFGEEFVRDITRFGVDVLRRFIDLMDYYIREIPLRNKKQLSEFERNVWHNGTTFATVKPPDNPDSSFKDQKIK